jgi:hypothetical protein
MVDISQGKHASLLKNEHWVNKDGTKARPAEVEKFQMEYFLHGQNDQSIKPFIAPDNQLYFIKFLQEAIIAQAPADETTRRNFLIPTYKQDDKTPHFPPSAGRMLYLMAYKIAGEFQKIEMAKIIEQKSETEKAELIKLQAQRRLIVTKNPTTGKFDQVQDITKIQPGQKIVPLISPPSDYGAGFMYGSGDFSQESTVGAGSSGVGTANIVPENAGLMPADITFPDEAVTMQTFQEGDANVHLTISDDPKNPENKFYTFEPENNPEKKFTISADQFKALLQDPDTGKLRTVAEVFDLIEQQRMNEQSEAAKILQAAQELLGGAGQPQITQGQPVPGQTKPQVEQKGQVAQPPQKATGQEVAPMATQGQKSSEAEKPEPPAKKEPAPSPVYQSMPNASGQQPTMVNRQSAPTQGAQTRPISNIPAQKSPFDLKKMMENKKPSYIPNAKPAKATPAPVEAKPQVTAAQPPAPTGYKPPVQQAAKSFFQKHGGKVVAGAVITSGFAAVLLPSWFTAINL